MQRNILIVEDDLSHIELIKRSLEHESTFNITHAKNCREAKTLLLSNSFNLVLADWRLPDGQGIDILKYSSDEVHLPVILMTSYGNENYAVEAIKTGAIDYIVKSPETFANLPYLLNKAIREWELMVENKRINKKLKESEELLRTIFDTAKDIIFVKDKDRRYKVVNRAFCELHEKTAEQIIGKSEIEFFCDKGIDFVNNTDQRAIDGQLVDEYSEFNICNKRKFIHVIKSPLYDNNNQIIGLCGVGRDITERIKSEEELFKLSEAVEQNPAAIVITNKEGIIEYVNSSMCELTQFSREDLIGNTPSLFKSGFLSSDDYKVLWDTILSGNKWYGEIKNLRKDKSEYWVITSIAPIKGKDGDITNFIGVQEDITIKKKFEKEIIEAKEKAIKSEKLKSEFLAQMSHEIRTPINALLSFSGLLKSELEDDVDDDLKSVFQFMEQAGKRIIRTIDLLLNMAELQIGSFEVSPAEFNLFPRVLDFIYQENLPEANKKGLEFFVVNNLEDDRIYADEYSTQQILSNIIENAIKFTEKGKVEICVYKSEDNTIIIEVADTGIGISEEYLGQLFTPFSQEQQGYTRQFEGNGLGLAIVKRYCELNDAEIKVESD